MDFYYFDADQRRGPVNAAQLRALAANGIITPDTTIEAGGRNLPARRIKGLEFAPADPPAAYPVEEPAPDPEPAPADDKEEKARKRKERERAAARASLEWWASSLRAIGWLEIIIGIVGGGFCMFIGSDNGNDALIGTGIGAIVGGFISSILPLALASIGRFLLTHHD